MPDPQPFVALNHFTVSLGTIPPPSQKMMVATLDRPTRCAAR
jgi:hypothetical protein